MNSFVKAKPPAPSGQTPKREWRASLRLGIEARQGKSILVETLHEGPLRVQRPFYPEGDTCCHVYLLHPPGGMVIGDELNIHAQLGPGAEALLTTPSAGKIYGAKNSKIAQRQDIQFVVKNGACLEWLPQETIVYNSARGRLASRIDLQGDAKIFAWDMLRLGRVASGEHFISGSCVQKLEIWRNEQPLFIERNEIEAAESLLEANWGLQNRNSLGTLYATMQLDRGEIDNLYQDLKAFTTKECLWGLTQKEDIFLARYLGDSISHCRQGFEFIWKATREIFKKKKAHRPRIWNT